MQFESGWTKGRSTLYVYEYNECWNDGQPGETIMFKDRIFETGFITLSVISSAVVVWLIFSI